MEPGPRSGQVHFNGCEEVEIEGCVEGKASCIVRVNERLRFRVEPKAKPRSGPLRRLYRYPFRIH